MLHSHRTQVLEHAFSIRCSHWTVATSNSNTFISKAPFMKKEQLMVLYIKANKHAKAPIPTHAIK